MDNERKIRDGLLWLSDRLMPNTLPIYFWRSGEQNLRPCACAFTMALGRRHVYVTCWHVWKGFLKFKEENPDSLLGGYIKGAPVDFTGYKCIESCERLDVAILYSNRPPVRLDTGRFAEEQFFRCTIETHPPKVGELLHVVGIPAAARMLNGHTIEHETVTLHYTVSSASDTRCVLAPEEGNRVHFGDALLSPSATLAGMSGSPVYVVRGKKPDLVGIFTDAGGTEATAFDTILVSPLTYLQADGMLDRLRMPP